MTETSQRLDRWLWCARIFKTRALAAKAISAGGVRLTRHDQTQRTDKPSFGVRPGDHLAVARGARIFVLEVVALGLRRGPAAEAAELYIDHSPPPVPRDRAESAAPSPALRDEGAGRPTKKDRRALDRLRDAP